MQFVELGEPHQYGDDGQQRNPPLSITERNRIGFQVVFDPFGVQLPLALADVAGKEVLLLRYTSKNAVNVCIAVIEHQPERPMGLACLAIAMFPQA
jgi:hypothetical protein